MCVPVSRPIDSAANILGDKSRRIGQVIEERPYLRYGLEGAGFVADGVSLAYGGGLRVVVSYALGAGQDQAINGLANKSAERFVQAGYSEDFAATASGGVATGLTLAISSKDAVDLVRKLPDLMQGLKQTARSAAASIHLRTTPMAPAGAPKEAPAYMGTAKSGPAEGPAPEIIQLSKTRFGHTFRDHGQDATEFLTRRAAASGKPNGQFLDDQAAARFLLDNKDKLTGGAVSLPIPKGLPARVIMPDGSYATPSTIRVVPKRGNIYTAYPEL